MSIAATTNQIENNHQWKWSDGRASEWKNARRAIVKTRTENSTHCYHHNQLCRRRTRCVHICKLLFAHCIQNACIDVSDANIYFDHMIVQ